MGIRNRQADSDQVCDRAEQNAYSRDGKPLDQWGNPIHSDRLSVYQLAERYGVKPATIWNWQRQGKLPQGFLLGSRRFWMTSDIQQWESEQ